MARQGAFGVEELIRQQVASLRQWKRTKLFKRHSRWDFQFTVMTYNILSQIAVQNHRYLYRYCKPTFLNEEYRIQRILPEILQSESDIICLQEVEQHLYENRIKNVFSSVGYESVFKRRTGAKSDGCAILWRRNMFQFVGKRDVEFSTKKCSILDRDNIALIAVLRPTHSRLRNMLLHVATTHLLFNPKRGDIKLCQLRWLLAELDKLSFMGEMNNSRVYHPVVLCGDFNIQPYSPLYQFLETGILDVTTILAGDLAGQSEGKGKGRMISSSDLMIEKLGINDASRYETGLDRKFGVARDISNTSFTNCSSGTAVHRFGSENPVDPNLLEAMKGSTDPRWIQTLQYLGHHDLAAEYASRIQRMSPATVKNFMKDENQWENSVSRCFSHSFNFVPAYKYHHLTPKDIPVTSMTSKGFNTVDHIFYNVKHKQDISSYSEGHLKLLSTYSLMSKDEIKQIGGLPNACLGTDHTSLIAHFAFCPQS